MSPTICYAVTSNYPLPKADSSWLPRLRWNAQP